MSTICAIALSTVGLCGIAQRSFAQPTTQESPRVFTLDAKKISAVRERARTGDASLQPALQALRKRADDALMERVVVVTTKPKELWAESGSPHDYVSISAYAWPDPQNPGGKWIMRDGQRNAEVHARTDGPKMGKMCSRVITLGQAWYFLNDRAAARGAVEQIRAWFLDESTRMNPNMEYAQSVPPSGKGNAWGIIDANSFPMILNVVGMLQDSGEWTSADDAALRAWFTEFNVWLTQSEIGRNEQRAKNNHGTFYDLLVASGAAYTGDDELARQILSKVGPMRLDKQIAADGGTPEELKRVDAVMYTIWNLTGLLDLAVLAGHYDIDLWNYPSADAPALKRAGAFLLPYVNGEKPWTFGEKPFAPHRPLPYLWRAGAVYKDAAFDRALREHCLTEERRSTWEKDNLNLLWPREDVK